MKLLGIDPDIVASGRIQQIMNAVIAAGLEGQFETDDGDIEIIITSLKGVPFLLVQHRSKQGNEERFLAKQG